MSTLIIKNDGIGDLILCSGLLADLAEQLGPLDLVTCSANREIAENIPGLRTVHYVSRDHIRFHPMLARLGIRWVCRTKQDREVFSHLRAHHYDTAICLRRYIRQSSLLLMQAVRADRKECCWRWPSNASPELSEDLSRGWNRHQGPDKDRSELTYFRSFARARFNLNSDSQPRLRCTEKVVAQPEEGRVGLCLSGGFKNWPQEHWVGFAERLHLAGKQVVLFGGPDAVACSAAVQARVPAAISLVNRLSFAASVPELARLELLVSNDTGFAHFAGLLVHRLLVILGGGTYDHFFPWPEAERHHLIFHGMECFGCNWGCRYPRMECFARLTVDEVSRYAEKILAGGAAPVHNTGLFMPEMCPNQRAPSAILARQELRV